MLKGLCFLRSSEAWKKDRIALNEVVMAPDVIKSFVPLLEPVAKDFVNVVHKRIEQQKSGTFSGNLSEDLFHFAFECKGVARCWMGESRTPL